MLQRPPPLIRILRPPSLVRSISSVSAPADAAKIAAHRTGGACPYDCNARHVWSDCLNVRLKRPVIDSSGGAVPGTMRDTP